MPVYSPEEDGSPVVPLPNIPEFPMDVDWNSIDSILMHRILKFPNSVHNTNDSISFAVDNSYPLSYEEVFEARQKGYAKLGLEVITIIEELQDKCNLPKELHTSQNSDWNRKKFLQEKL